MFIFTALKYKMCLQIETRIKFCVGQVTYQQANQTSSMAWDLVSKADFNSRARNFTLIKKLKYTFHSQQRSLGPYPQPVEPGLSIHTLLTAAFNMTLSCSSVPMSPTLPFRFLDKK
jgi:hypothetical protein